MRFSFLAQDSVPFLVFTTVQFPSKEIFYLHSIV